MQISLLNPNDDGVPSMPNVRIDWIRHGLSCANVLTGLNVFFRGSLAPDAMLTDCGVTQAQQTGDKVLTTLNNEQPYNIVVCSQLTRAIETAFHLFFKIENDGTIQPRFESI